MPLLSLSLLGPPRVEHDCRTIELDRHKGLALLAYLAVTGEHQARDSLAALLWPNLDQARARGGLRRTLSALNTALPGDWWDIEREAIHLRPIPDFRLDVSDFCNLLAACRAHGHPADDVCPSCLQPLAAAVALHRDDFLAGFTLRDCPAFDDWQFAQAESLRRDLSRALERLVRAYSRQGEYEAAIGYARRWLALDPLHEPAYQHLMCLYAWAGQPQAALRQYAECARVLERELGVPPQVSTAQLCEAIKANQPPPPPIPRPVEAKPSRVPGVPAAAGVPATVVSMLDRIVRGQLVGRERELAQADALWQRVVAGDSHVLLVSGEPGIGKTRLGREIAARAEAAGARVLVGECYAEGGPPYAPIARIIREALSRTGDGLSLPDSVLADLISLAPDLRAKYPDVPANPMLELDIHKPESDQQRLFDRVFILLEALAQAAAGPLLLFVEDAHWADPDTLFLLRHLARRSRAGQVRLLTVLTYRDAEADLNEARIFKDVLLDLNRERLAEHVSLPRLSREHTRDLLAGMLAAGEVSAEFLDSVYAETEGNPFFVEEVCKTLIEEGKVYRAGETWRRADMQAISLPQTVRGAILRRVERLPDPTQETLRLAATFGREFDFETLQRASDCDEEALIAGLEQAGRAQLVGESSRAGRLTFSFAHALIPFTLRESLSGMRRQRLHRRAAEAIAALRPEDDEALAYHFAAAREREKAVLHSRRAAQRAETIYAYEAAVQHWRAALDLLDPGGAVAQAETRLAVLEGLADAYHFIGEHRRAIGLYQEALALWSGLASGASGASADTWIAVRLHRKIIETYGRVRRFADLEPVKPLAQASIQAALALIEGQTPHVEMTHLLKTLAGTAWEMGLLPDLAAAERYARAAVEIAEQLDAPVELSAALGVLATIYRDRGLLREGVSIALRRLALSRDPRFGDVYERIDALSGAGNARKAVGEHAQALEHYLEAERLADQIKDLDWSIYALAGQAECWFGLDRWEEMQKVDDKRRALEQAFQLASRVCFLCGLGAAICALRGDFDRARALKEESYERMEVMDDASLMTSPYSWRRIVYV